MNIEGVERRLPLFEPPIDPGLLVRAVAAGLDIEDVLAGLGAPLPHHRFSVMIAKAIEVCGDLRALGAAALSALEKRDAEELALLRSEHEIGLLKLTEQVRKQQIDEADMTLQGLGESRRTAEERLKHYQRLLDRNDFTIPDAGETIMLAQIVTPLAKTGLDGKEQGLGVSQTELDQINLMEEARAASLRAGVANTIGGVLLAIGGILSAVPRGSSPGDYLGDLGGGLTGAGQGLQCRRERLSGCRRLFERDRQHRRDHRRLRAKTRRLDLPEQHGAAGNRADRQAERGGQIRKEIAQPGAVQRPHADRATPTA